MSVGDNFLSGITGYVEIQEREIIVGDLTNSSPNISNIADTSYLSAGMTVSGTNIPANTTISSIPSANSLILSANATATLAGNVLTITGEVAEYAFGKWRIPMQSNLPRVNNFTSAYQVLRKGLIRANIVLEGPYDAGNMPLAVNGSYLFTLGWTASLALEVTAVVNDITPDNNVEDAPRCNISAESSGAFTARIT
jgi:hypothetical protein